jgi:flavin-dependent dehydrogenase
MKDGDLIITGSGPTGISTALHLLWQAPGWAGCMIVLEKVAHPRHKLCGGGITRLGMDALRQRVCQASYESDNRQEQESSRIDYGTTADFTHQ